MDPSSEDCFCCPQPRRGTLPLKIHNAVKNGDTFELQSWLTEKGDVNATDMKGRTMLLTACLEGHFNVVSQLLSHMDVHLNIQSEDYSTPLIAASCKGHLNCVELILSSATKCQINYNKVKQGMTAIMHAVKNDHWKIVGTLLSKQKLQHPLEIEYIFAKSLKAKEWDFARDIISLCCHNNVNYLKYLLTIYENDKWEYVSAAKLFRLAVHYEADSTKSVLQRMLAKKDWKLLEDSLRILWKDTKVDVDIAEAILKRSNYKETLMLLGGEVDIATRSGGLIVAALGDTSKTVADFLLDFTCFYPETVVNDALIIACLCSSVEVITVLLKKRDFSYKTLVRAYHVAQNVYCRLLVNRALQKEIESILPLPKEEKEEPSDSEDEDNLIVMGRPVDPSEMDSVALILKIRNGSQILPFAGEHRDIDSSDYDDDDSDDSSDDDDSDDESSDDDDKNESSQTDLNIFEAHCAELHINILRNTNNHDCYDDCDGDYTTDEDDDDYTTDEDDDDYTTDDDDH